MKIEVECVRCQSILRLDRIHAGKQVRCPVCGTTSPVPSEPQPSKPVKPSGFGDVGDTAYGTRSRSPQYDESPQYDSPYDLPGEAPFEQHREYSSDSGRDSLPDERRRRREFRRFQEERPVRAFATNHTDSYGVLSIGIGVLAFVMAFSCICISPMLAIVGAVIAFRARGQVRLVAFLVNLAAFVMGVINSGFFVLFFMFAQ